MPAERQLVALGLPALPEWANHAQEDGIAHNNCVDKAKAKGGGGLEQLHRNGDDMCPRRARLLPHHASTR